MYKATNQNSSASKSDIHSIKKKTNKKLTTKIFPPMPDVSTRFSTSGDRTDIRIVVAGDRGTGKSSLIASAATDSFPDNVAPVLPITCLPADFYLANVPITIIDTSSRYAPICIMYKWIGCMFIFD